MFNTHRAGGADPRSYLINHNTINSDQSRSNLLLSLLNALG
jgi:hypothetical protein